MSTVYGFYRECPHTGILETVDTPFEYNIGEKFICRGSYGREKTLKRFKEELLLCDVPLLTALVDKVYERDVVQMWRTNCFPEGWVLSSDDKEPHSYPCWVIDVCDILDRGDI